MHVRSIDPQKASQGPRVIKFEPRLVASGHQRSDREHNEFELLTWLEMAQTAL